MPLDELAARVVYSIQHVRWNQFLDLIMDRHIYLPFS